MLAPIGTFASIAQKSPHGKSVAYGTRKLLGNRVVLIVPILQ